MNFQILSKILGIYTTLQELEMLHSEPHPHRGYSTKSYAGRLPPLTILCTILAEKTYSNPFIHLFLKNEPLSHTDLRLLHPIS